MVSVGQSGVWGVNVNDDIFYRTGTYGDPDSQGTGVSVPYGRVASNFAAFLISFKYLFRRFHGSNS